eukprot:112061_1
MPPSLLNLLRCCFLFISVHPLPNNQTYSPSHSPITQSPSNFYTTLPPTDQSHTKIVDAEASGKHLVINCGTGCIRIVHASYGMNCNITLTNDELLSLQNACNNRTICTYEIDTTIIDDPSPNCDKEYLCKYQCVSSCKQYVAYDRFNTISDWKTHGNVHTVSSPKCPSTSNYTARFKGKKLCISNSMNSFWDGQYEWQYYDDNVQGSIYYNTKSNKYIYEYIEHNIGQIYYKYYINDYQQDTIMMTRCVDENITDIQYCVGNWQNHEHVPHNSSYAWIKDANMTSSTCNDICTKAMSYSATYPLLKAFIGTIPQDATFVWSHYNATKQSNVYYCVGYEQGLYLYGFYLNEHTYKCVIEATGWPMPLDWFTFAGNHTLLQTKDCAYSLGQWQYDKDLWITICSSNANTALDTLETLPTFQYSQICVQDSHHYLLDGVYKWLYYDFDVQGSVYYNKEKEAYIQPYINATGTHYYNIYGNQNNVTIHAKCNASIITQCFESWLIFYDDTWNIDTNMVANPCQDVCVNGHREQHLYGKEFVLTYSYFDKAFRSNVYTMEIEGYDGATLNLFAVPCALTIVNGQVCLDCPPPAESSCYADDSYGFNLGLQQAIDRNLEVDSLWVTLWIASVKMDMTDVASISLDDPTKHQVICVCPIWQLSEPTISNIQNCSHPYSWTQGNDPDPDMTASLCHPIATQRCVQLEANSTIYRTYQTNETYEDLAIGFDLNLVRFESTSSSGVLTIKYMCDMVNDTYYPLTSFKYNQMISLVQNFVYALPSDICNYASTVSIALTTKLSSVYIDNIYLYYNFPMVIYSDNITSESDWFVSSDAANIEHCTSNCSVLYVSSPTQHDYISISTTIALSDTRYTYHDMNLQWSLKTNGLSDDAIANVEYQCNQNFLYVYGVCTVRSYDANNDCTDQSCAFQSYKLPSECDLSSEILIQFTLQSSSSNDRIYIDYVSLTHSDKTGRDVPLCRTASPTSSPTFSPTQSPSFSPTVFHEFNLWDYLKDHPQHVAMGSAGVLLLVITLVAVIHWCVKRWLIRKYKEEMVVHNAMVIPIVIGKYDAAPQTPDSPLENICLPDLEGIEKDVQNLCCLFGPNHLNYTVYPEYDMKNPKIHWTEQEIVDVLNTQAKQLNDEIEHFDALIVAVSGHGMDNNICTSDYKLIDTVYIHRVFSAHYPTTRDIPRIFLFDCCDGSNEQRSRTIAASDDVSKYVQVPTEEHPGVQKPTSQGKQVTAGDLEITWGSNEQNPDHMLVEVHAANKGFQSKLSRIRGSLMLYSFVAKTLADLDQNGDKCIYEVFDDIQHELAQPQQGKQQIVATYHDKTRYVKFKKNDKDIDVEVDRETEPAPQIELQLHTQDTIRSRDANETVSDDLQCDHDEQKPMVPNCDEKAELEDNVRNPKNDQDVKVDVHQTGQPIELEIHTSDTIGSEEKSIVANCDEKTEVAIEDSVMNLKAINWSNVEVVKWIISLQNGKFKQYSKAFGTQRIKGTDLEHITMPHLMDFGITIFSDRREMYEHIQNVVSNKILLVQSNDEDSNETVSDDLIQNDEDEEKAELEDNVQNYQAVNPMHWSNVEVVKWIISLQNGKFKQYAKAFGTQEIKGTDLKHITMHDLMDFDVKIFSHRRKIYNNIQNLVSNKILLVQSNDEDSNETVSDDLIQNDEDEEKAELED